MYVGIQFCQVLVRTYCIPLPSPEIGAEYFAIFTANRSGKLGISETERYLWKYYFVASLIVDMKSFVYLLESIVNMAHFNNVCSFLSRSDSR